jgi:hypothetical protein
MQPAHDRQHMHLELLPGGQLAGLLLLLRRRRQQQALAPCHCLAETWACYQLHPASAPAPAAAGHEQPAPPKQLLLHHHQALLLLLLAAAVESVPLLLPAAQ